MKLKIVIVDLEIPPCVKMWALRIGVPLAVLLGGTAVAYASGLITWANGQTLNASDLNANFTTIQNEITALQNEIGGDGGAQNLQAQVTAVHTAIISSTGSVTSSWPSSWIATVNYSHPGSYGLNFAAGTFSTTPVCVAMADAGNQVAPAFQMTDVFSTGGLLTASYVPAGTTTPAGVDTTIFLICIGS